MNRNVTKERRLGSFLIPGDWIRANPDVVWDLLRQVLIVRADCNYAPYCIAYTGYSYRFESLGEGEEVPRYPVHMTYYRYYDEQQLRELTFGIPGTPGVTTVVNAEGMP